MERNTVTLIVRFTLPEDLLFEPGDKAEVVKAFEGIGASEVEVLGFAALNDADFKQLKAEKP